MTVTELRALLKTNVRMGVYVRVGIHGSTLYGRIDIPKSKARELLKGQPGNAEAFVYKHDERTYTIGG